MELEAKYREYKRKQILKISGMALIVVMVALICLTYGTESNLVSGFRAIINYAVGNGFCEETAAVDKVLVFLRLPRICLAIMAGIGLAVSGLMMQSVTRNFLVSPFTLGVSSAAAFGASLCIVFGSATIFLKDAFIIGSAFLSSLLSILVVFVVVNRIGITANSIILVGIALNYFFSAMTASLQFFAQENKLAAVVQWTFGTFNRANWHAVIVIGFVIAIGCIVASQFFLKWNAMASGDDEMVKSLGLSPERLRAQTMFLSVLITATVISFTGVIGFVGLIAPHMARMLVGSDHTYLFPMTAGLGAVLLLTADAIGKFALYPVNVPVGIVVSFIGVPIFINLILKTRKSGL